MANHAGGISIMAFVVALAVSMGYYQFIFLPEANAKPHLPPEILEPEQTTKVSIVKDAGLQTNPDNFVPKDARTTLGLSNKVVWTNNDVTAHTVTSDDPPYVDKVNGPFDSLQQQESVPGGYLLPGKTFEFVFTHEGTYPYHCTPHPFMTGKVEVVPNFA
jgi:plastocyanin